jgi:hypothetical protein
METSTQPGLSTASTHARECNESNVDTTKLYSYPCEVLYIRRDANNSFADKQRPSRLKRLGDCGEPSRARSRRHLSPGLRKQRFSYEQWCGAYMGRKIPNWVVTNNDVDQSFMSQFAA